MDGDDDWVVIEAPPKLLSTRIETNVENRYAKTLIVSKVENDKDKAQEVTFSIVTPDQAFISGFTLEIDGKKYVSKVQEKEEAKKTYDMEVSKGRGTAHVATSTRDSNRFTVSINIEPRSKAAFYLKYEELLARKDNKYEIILNMNPGQFVEDFQVEVNIKEARPIKFVKVPCLRSGNEAIQDNSNLDPEANVQMASETDATVKFKPSVEKQKSLMKYLQGKTNGLSGQFVVQYDVIRDPQGGEVLIDESGYFVHFFAPELPLLNKQVIFVLDVSGSMHGRKIEQLKQAMDKILNELKPEDSFSIVEFNATVSVWDIALVEVTYQKSCESYYYSVDSQKPEEVNKTAPLSFKATPEMIDNAHRVITKLEASGGTDIHGSLEVGLEIINRTEADDTLQPIVIFLTDGEPTAGITNTTAILSKTTSFNKRKVPIFSLSFGDGADRDFLQKLSLKNYAFSKHIYEASDASLQLEEFYKGISSPLLANVNFKYVNNVESVTTTIFPVLFHGSEFYISGIAIKGFQAPDVIGCGRVGSLKFKPNLLNVSNSLERLWAYLTIKKLLQDDKTNDDKGLKERALELALKYSFVTDVSSLVVVKPDSSSAVDTEDASKSVDHLDLRVKKKLIKKRLASPRVPIGHQAVRQFSAVPQANLFGCAPVNTGFGFARARSVQTDSLSLTNTFGAYPSFRTKAGAVPQGNLFGCAPVNTDGAPEDQSFESAAVSADSLVPEEEPKLEIKIIDFSIEPTVLNRYETTIVRIIATNKNTTRSAVSNLPLILPQGAFVSKGFLEVANKKYQAYVQAKDAALSALKHSITGLKEASFIHLKDQIENEYILTITIPPSSEVLVQVVYERMIPKIDGKYLVEFTVLPQLLGDTVSANVSINGLRPVKSAKAMFEYETKEKRINETTVEFSIDPNILKQKVLEGSSNGTKFGVSFEFEPDPFNGEVLIDDGYFTFPFVPLKVPPTNKLVVFVLDSTSTLATVQNIFKNLLNRLESDDQFIIVQSGTTASIWDVEASKISYQESVNALTDDKIMPQPFKATKENIKKAENVADVIGKTSESDVQSALSLAIKSVSENKEKNSKPVIVLIKVVEPSTTTVGEEVIDKINEINASKIPLFAIIVGDYLPSLIYQKLCASSNGFVKRIYKFLDSDQQINEFYNQLSMVMGLNLACKDDSKIIDDTDSGKYPAFTLQPRRNTQRELHTAFELILKQMRERSSTSSIISANSLEFTYSVVTDITSLVMAKL
ncbi:uncharacterized protein LOC143194223 isoform X4 [Rhynchophorus ferrugineus]|uniref:uncharacterized protein LOC143194223 isoform X4 n=1 Tax=Rhynchophorus ferrugineus TaxID=354439 RepID=UPI003FCCC7EF